MSVRVNIRKAVLHKRREQDFQLRQSVNEMVIPSYDALKDPFLSGFFQHPQMLTNLKKTGIITRKKRFSLQKYKELVTDPKLLQSAEKLSKHRKAKSQSKQPEGERLPKVEEQRIQPREWLKSEGGARPKRIYKSVKRSYQS